MDTVRMFCSFFNDTATTEIYTLSLHDALPICDGDALLPGLLQRSGPPTVKLPAGRRWVGDDEGGVDPAGEPGDPDQGLPGRSEEHTSELQSRQYLVCRLLLEKKKGREAPYPLR